MAYRSDMGAVKEEEEGTIGQAEPGTGWRGDHWRAGSYEEAAWGTRRNNTQHIPPGNPKRYAAPYGLLYEMRKPGLACVCTNSSAQITATRSYRSAGHCTRARSIRADDPAAVAVPLHSNEFDRLPPQEVDLLNQGKAHESFVLFRTMASALHPWSIKTASS